MAEDFTTYTEVDPHGDITETTSRVTINQEIFGEYLKFGYVYADKGIDYFDGNFLHNITVCFQQLSNTSDVLIIWGLSNDLDDARYLENSDLSEIYVNFYCDNSSNQWLECYENDSGTMYTVGRYQFSGNNKVFYLTIIRNEDVGTYGNLSVYIYSDEIRETLLASFSMDLHTSKKDYRYIYAIQTYNQDGSYQRFANAYVENFNLLNGSIISRTVTETATATDSHSVVIGDVLPRVITETVVAQDSLTRAVSQGMWANKSRHESTWINKTL